MGFGIPIQGWCGVLPLTPYKLPSDEWLIEPKACKPHANLEDNWLGIPIPILGS